MLWVQFGFIALAVILAGWRLAKAADGIAYHTGLGRLWVGSILLAGATSLPEVVTSISSGLLDLPDIAVGNVFGSNIFNMTIIALADVVGRHGPFFQRISPGHLLSASLGMILSAMAVLAILLRLEISFLGVGMDTSIILLVYIFGARLLTRYEKKRMGSASDALVTTAGGVTVSDHGVIMSAGRAWGEFAMSAIVVVTAGTLLSILGDKIAIQTGLGGTFVGSTLIAAATSLPEVVASLAAALSGHYDLAMGNVLGSNIFNMIILFAADLAYRGGPILFDASPTHAISALFGLILSGLAVIGLVYRSERRILRMGPDSLSILVVYVIAAYILYLKR